MKRKTLYLECATGISGDMTVAALLDLGANAEKLDAVLRSLQLEGFDTRISRRLSHGMDGCDFEVRLHADEEHQHDHEHAHGHHEHGHHEHEHEHEHGHEHEHAHEHEHGHHEHRNLADVTAVIDRGEMTDRARELAKRIFQIVAEAEARAHGKPIEDVHFHEVGAIDSIVDIVAAAVCIDDLDIDACVVTGLSEGTGMVRCAHGDLPIPVPAVAAIAERFAIPLRIQDVKGEMVTPTGIAIAAALRTETALPAAFTIERTGVGLGKRDFGLPNLLRAMIISPTVSDDRLWMVESNIDDASGEQLGLAMTAIFEAGAKDVHYVPCIMKKSRPAYLLRILVSDACLSAVEDAVFRNTPTIGLRKSLVERTCLAREIVSVELPVGTVEVKRCTWRGHAFYYPEYESVKRISAASGVDFKTIFDEARAEAER